MMSGVPLGGVVRQLHRLAAAPASEVSDGHLLERFCRAGEAAAFEALVRRHGAMVLGVCRRVLRDGHEAEDAFQATFLLLLRKAGSLRQPELLGPWLYGVAYRTALKARAVGARRRERFRALTEQAAVARANALDRQEVRPVLDAAIQRLPEKYRVPFVLCYLEGMTNAQAARRLACPLGTIATRLSRARERIRSRLVKQGFAPWSPGV